MSDFIAKFLPNTIRNEIDYLQKGELALNAETPKTLANNKGFVTYIIDSNLPCDWTYVGPDVRKDTEILMRFAPKPVVKLESFSDKNEQMSIAVHAILTHDRSKAMNLQTANDVLCNDFSVVLASVCADVENFKFASKNMRDNYIIALASVRVGFNTLKWVSERLRDNHDVALASVCAFPNSRCEISTRLQSNKDFILELLRDFPTSEDTVECHYDILSDFIKSPVDMDFLYRAFDVVKPRYIEKKISSSSLPEMIIASNHKELGVDNILDMGKKYIALGIK